MWDDPTLAYGLIVLGLVLLLADVLLYSGVLFVLSLAALLAGFALLFRISTTQGVGTLLVLLLVGPVLLSLAVRYGQKSFLGRLFFLPAPSEEEARTELPSQRELEQLRGRYGRTISALRPSGITDFDGRRVDSISEGGLIEPGQWVRCIDVRPGQVVVRPVEAPPRTDSMDTTELL